MVESQSDLGVIVFDNLKWGRHIRIIATKSNLIRRTFKNTTPDLFREMCSSLFRIRLRYLVTSKEISRNSKLFAYEERLKILQLPALERRRQRDDLVEIFRVFLSFCHSPSHRNVCRMVLLLGTITRLRVPQVKFSLVQF